jgi:hypothetical protein
MPWSAGTKRARAESIAKRDNPAAGPRASTQLTAKLTNSCAAERRDTAPELCENRRKMRALPCLAQSLAAPGRRGMPDSLKFYLKNDPVLSNHFHTSNDKWSDT